LFTAVHGNETRANFSMKLAIACLELYRTTSLRKLGRVADNKFNDIRENCASMPTDPVVMARE